MDSGNLPVSGCTDAAATAADSAVAVMVRSEGFILPRMPLLTSDTEALAAEVDATLVAIDGEVADEGVDTVVSWICAGVMGDCERLTNGLFTGSTVQL